MRKTVPGLFFKESPWGWSLKIYEGKQLLGIMQASTPVSCLDVVQPHFAGRHEPLVDYRILICCNANHRQLKLDRASFDRLVKATSDSQGHELLQYFGEHFNRDLAKIADSSSVTVMVDASHEVIDSTALLKRVFGWETA